MALKEITGVRDLTFSKWHRKNLPDDCSWIDIDCCHYCKHCLSLLALFELVRSPDEWSIEDVCRRKRAFITERVGFRLDIPVFKIAYTGEPMRLAAVMRMGKPAIEVMSVEQLAEWIDRLHDCEFCRRHKNGRFKRR